MLSVKDSSNNTLASFTYRADGMRQTMTTSAGTITFHYDQDKNVSYETDSSNNVLASYTWNGGEPVSMTRGGQTYYYQLNGHGDVVALTNSTGAVVNTYDYDAFGNVLKQTGTVVNPYLYAGYRYDKETGLYYLQSRYYKPDTGRFLTRDTFIGFEHEQLSLNRYAYVQNNPVEYIDVDGHYRHYVWITTRSVSIYLSHQTIDWLASIVGTSGVAAGSNSLQKLLGTALRRIVILAGITVGYLYQKDVRGGSRGLTLNLITVEKHWYYHFYNPFSGKYWWDFIWGVSYSYLSIRYGRNYAPKYRGYGYYY